MSKSLFSLASLLPAGMAPAVAGARGPRDAAAPAITQHVPVRPSPPSKGNRPMPRTTPSSSPREIVLAALEKQSPISRAELLNVTGLNDKQLSNAMQVLINGTKQVITYGSGTARQYGLPGTVFTASTGDGTFAAALKKAETTKKPARKQPAARSTGTSHPTNNARATPARAPRTFVPCGPGSLTRAVKKFDGGMLVLEGGSIVHELSAAHLAAVLDADISAGAR